MKRTAMLLLLLVIGTSVCYAEAQKEYFTNGNLKWEKNLKNGEPDGLTKWYYKSGALQMEENYSNGVLHGICKVYYDNGQLKAETHYKNGVVDGSARSFYKDGTLMETLNYKNGKQDGPTKAYDMKGVLRFDLFFKDGFPEGEVKKYHDNGKLQFLDIYKHKERISRKTYDKKGKLVSTEFFDPKGIIITKDGYLAAMSETLLDKATRIVDENDHEALQKLMDSKQVIMLKEGLEVYVVEEKMFSGKVKIRPKGEILEVWTVKEAISK
jgi:antitoxin component YwqK of YwqJK toxin-antitoxin module